jgi:hypothetical protein
MIRYGTIDKARFQIPVSRRDGLRHEAKTIIAARKLIPLSFARTAIEKATMLVQYHIVLARDVLESSEAR